MQMNLKLDLGYRKSLGESIASSLIMPFPLYMPERLKIDANVTNFAGCLPLHLFNPSIWVVLWGA